MFLYPKLNERCNNNLLQRTSHGASLLSLLEAMPSHNAPASTKSVVFCSHEARLATYKI